MEGIVPHQIDETGGFLCSATAKHANVVSILKGLMVCGHCMKPVLNKKGEQIPFTMRDLFEIPWVEGKGRVIGG